jgi:hypothetical protein
VSGERGPTREARRGDEQTRIAASRPTRESINGPAGQKRPRTLAADAQSIASHDATRRPRRREAGSSGASGEQGPDRADLLKSLVAYTGIYRIEGDKWITNVDVSANPAWVGTEQTRFFRVDGERLQESTAAMQLPARPEKGMVRFVLMWERAK